MAAAVSTTSQVTAAVNAWLSSTLLSRAYPYFVHAMWGQVQDLPRNVGATIKFRKYASLTAATTALTEGVTPNGSQLSVTDLSATPLQYGDYVTTSDYLDATVIEPMKAEIARLQGDQLGDTIDQLVRDVIIAGDTVQYASSATSRATVAAGMILNGDEVREAVMTLQGNNAKPVTSQIDPSSGFNSAPVAAAYIGILDQKTLFDLKKDADWVPVEEYAASDGKLGAFEKGKLDDVRFVLSSQAKTFSSTVTVHATLIMGQEYYGISRISGEAINMYVNPPGSGEDPLHQRSSMGWKITLIAKRLQENFAVRVEHATTN